MRTNPCLELLKDPDTARWAYYSILHVSSVVMDDFLLITITILLIDKSLHMDLYKVHNLPALHPEISVQFTYVVEGHYLAI